MHPAQAHFAVHGLLQQHLATLDRLVNRPQTGLLDVMLGPITFRLDIGLWKVLQEWRSPPSTTLPTRRFPHGLFVMCTDDDGDGALEPEGFAIVTNLQPILHPGREPRDIALEAQSLLFGQPDVAFASATSRPLPCAYFMPADGPANMVVRTLFEWERKHMRLGPDIAMALKKLKNATPADSFYLAFCSRTPQS